jgi:phosphatidylserine/phosphatidylglycerophosphate/cardiolipin synthase-like enzyme
MRLSLASMALTVALLATAVSGCTTAPPTAPEPTKPTLTLIVGPQDGYQPIYDFISGARVSLDMTMYQLSDAKAQDALKAAAKRGVKVRVLLDSDTQGGGNSTMNQAAYSDLATNGADVRT